MKGRREPVKAPAFLGFLETGQATIRIECVAAEDLPPRGYMRGSIAPRHVVAEASEESSVEWELLADGRFDRTTLMEILAMAFSFELVGDDEEGRMPPGAAADPQDAPSSRAGGGLTSDLPPFLSD